MGDMLKAECPCGFKSRELLVGCGMADPNYWGLLVACPQCHVIRVEDSRSGKRICRKCEAALYYLHEGGGFTPPDVLTRFKVLTPWNLGDTEEEGEEPLPEVRYRCPKCGKLEMQLVWAGCWD